MATRNHQGNESSNGREEVQWLSSGLRVEEKRRDPKRCIEVAATEEEGISRENTVPEAKGIKVSQR